MTDAEHGAKARYLLAGAVEGISFYGNCLAPEEMITVRYRGRVTTLPIGEWCENIIKDGVDAAHPVAEVLSFDPQKRARGLERNRGRVSAAQRRSVEITSALGRRWASRPIIRCRFGLMKTGKSKMPANWKKATVWRF